MMIKGKYIVWWKIPNLLMSTEQMITVGLYPKGKQLRLWL